jgi:hypothetical protein
MRDSDEPTITCVWEIDFEMEQDNLCLPNYK